MSGIKRTITPNDPANFTPTREPQIPLQPFRYWCQKVLPLVYDDSLSYYELLCKVVDYLNKTMEDVSNMDTDMTNLYEGYTKLQDYVNKYFDGLDVQEEINNKLDEMAADGTLYNIIKKYTDPIIESQNNKISVLESRVNEFTKLPDGSTAGDAELVDIRVAYNGIDYPSAGESVRSQVNQLFGGVNIIEKGISEVKFNLFDSTKIIEDKFIAQVINTSKLFELTESSGKFTSEQVWVVKQGDVIYVSTGYATIGIYNAQGVLVEKFNDGEKEHTITNASARYMRFSSNNTATYTTNFVLNINRPLLGHYVGYDDSYNAVKNNEYAIDFINDNKDVIESYNKVDPSKIIDGKYFSFTIGKTYNDMITSNPNSIYSPQKILCKKGDVIRITTSYCYVIFYDQFDYVVEVWNDDKTEYTVQNENVKYLTYSCISNSDNYKKYFMLTVNKEMSTFYVPFGITVHEYDTSYKYNKPLILFTFDNDVSDGDDSNIVKLMLDKYGYKFTFNGANAYTETLLKRGCDLGTYSNVVGEVPADDTINSSDPEDLDKWYNYVYQAKKRQEDMGFYNPTLWEARQLRYGTALEKALIDNGYKFCRATSSSSNVYLEKNVDYQKFPCLVARDVQLTTIQTALTNLSRRGGVLCVLFHKILDTVPEKNTWDISTEYFTQIMDLIKDYVDDNRIEVVTARELFRRYNNNGGYENDYNRIIKSVL